MEEFVKKVCLSSGPESYERGKREVRTEEAEDTDSLLADDSSRLLKHRRGERGRREDNAKTVQGGRSFRRAEGSFSMKYEEEEGDLVNNSAAMTASQMADDGGSSSKVKGTTRSNADGLTTCLKRMVKLVRSMGGLIIILLAYTFFGAWLMMTIEGPREDAQKREVSNERESIAEQLKNNTQELRAGHLNDSEWEAQTTKLLLHLEAKVHSSGVASTSKKKWTFLGSVLFCVTTYTTIGYGNIAPATNVGRIATMLYSTIGIPLALIVLADLGRRFTVALKFLWGFIRRYYYTGYCRKIRKRGNKGSYDMNESKMGIDSGDGVEARQDGVYTQNAIHREEAEKAGGDTSRRMEKAAGVGAKTILREEDEGEKSLRAGSPRKDVVDLSRRSQSVERSSNVNSKASSMQDCRISAYHSGSLSKTDSVFIDQAELSEDFKLPVLVAVGFIFAYIFLGAGMYTIWEDWTYLESFYFVFITTSTIGFGDILPEHPNFFLLSCVYTFLGLALVSMTINVIMEWLAKTIDRAKEKVDQAKEKAVAKAKVARGVLSEVGSRAKSKVLHTVAKEGSASPQLKGREENTETEENIQADSNRQNDRESAEDKQDVRQPSKDRDEEPKDSKELKVSSQGNHVASNRLDETADETRKATPKTDMTAGTSGPPHRSDLLEKGGADLRTPSSDNETSFRTATDFTASSDSINEQSERK